MLRKQLFHAIRGPRFMLRFHFETPARTPQCSFYGRYQRGFLLLAITVARLASTMRHRGIHVQPMCQTSLVLILVLVMAACGGGNTVSSSSTPSPSAPSPNLTAADVTAVVNAVAGSTNAPMVIAVSDRGGNLLGLYKKASAPAQGMANFSQMVDARELSLALARTAAYFSNDQAPLSSRTVRFISGIHFPPGVTNASNAALYGIENTNRGCPLNVTFAPGKNINPSRTINGASTGFGIITGKADIN